MMFELFATDSPVLIGGAFGWFPFLVILLLVFGLFLALAGAFTSYFGSGKSCTIGVILLVVGIVAVVGTAFWYHVAPSGSLYLGTLIWQTFLIILAAAIGALIAIAIFLVAIMKS